MIREIRIGNLALIDDLALELNEGLTVFTGETGAGKSILVGAIGLLLGDRASSEFVRSGFEEAHVSGTFALARIPRPLRELLDQNDIPVDEKELIVRRTVARSGRNRVLVNQIPVPLATLKTIGDYLVDLHGQHEHQSLLKPDTARLLVDSLPGVAEPRAAFAGRHSDFLAAREALETYDREADLLAQRRDLIEFQHREISSLKLKPAEEQELEAEVLLLSSASDRAETMAAISRIVEGGEDGSSLEHLVAEVRRQLGSLQRFDQRATPWCEQMEAVATTVAELSAFCWAYLEDSRGAADPARLDSLNDRLARIQRLKKKHGCSYDGLIEKEAALKADLDSLENRQADRAQLDKRLTAARKLRTEAARELSGARRKATAEFDKEVAARMARLGFEGGCWRTAYAPLEEPGPYGAEEIAFDVQTNPGEPFMPLAKTASGGEISRLMLAIKTVLAARDHIPVLIFDEIDTGIGGMLARAVASALADLAVSHQVLCISHLHQIASVATHHVQVYKAAEGGRTVTHARALSGDEKVREIARMLGDESEISRQHARQLLRKP